MSLKYLNICFFLLFIKHTLPCDEHKRIMKKYVKEGIKTTRLILKLTEKKDIEELIPYVLDEKHMWKYQNNIEWPKNNNDARKFLSYKIKIDGYYYFCIRLKETNEAIGQFSIKFLKDKTITISFWIAKKHTRRGYMSEIISTNIISDIFNEAHGYNILYLLVYKSNLASKKTIKKIIKSVKEKCQCVVEHKQDEKTFDEIFFIKKII